MATHTSLSDLFTDIADEIRAKKGDEDPIVADDFPSEIANLPSGADLSEYFNMTPTAEEMTTTEYWLLNNYFKKGAELIIPDSITNLRRLCASESYNMVDAVPKIICNNNVTILDYLYLQSKVKSIDFSGLNTSNVVSMQRMCQDCRSLKEVDISNLNLLKLSNNGLSYYERVFSGCYLLEKAIITPLITKNLYEWFHYCYSLKTLILLKEDGVCGYYSTFSSCYHMDGTVDPTYNPQGLKDGRIYVPDNLVNDYKSASGWSTYADQILPLSQYVE